MLKNILWKFKLYIFNIDSYIEYWNYSEINGINQTLMLIIS